MFASCGLLKTPHDILFHRWCIGLYHQLLRGFQALSTLLINLQLGYTLYRRVLGYYSGEEDAYDMRKAMPRDVHQNSIVPLDRPVHPHELEHD